MRRFLQIAGLGFFLLSGTAMAEERPTFSIQPKELLPAMNEVANNAGRRLVGIRHVSCGHANGIYACGARVDPAYALRAYSLREGGEIVMISIEARHPRFQDINDMLFTASMIVRTFEPEYSEDDILDMISKLARAGLSLQGEAEAEGDFGHYSIYHDHRGWPVFQAIPRPEGAAE